ncbi:hypothetical protein GX645_01035 [Candidatus Sumerlaeota bacterium]|nr:hypothetical protein [Candidatus Sumerlaeales bacterium]NLD61022.1 hypothetical protein [Candidatus Sumerlaeota bacterium]
MIRFFLLSSIILILGICGAAEPTTSTASLEIGAPVANRDKGVRSLTLNLRMVDAENGTTVAPTSLSLLRNISNIEASKIDEISWPQPVKPPYQFYSILSVPRNGATPEFFSMGELPIPVADDGTSGAALTLRLRETTLHPQSNLFWIKVAAPGYYPVLCNAGILARYRDSGIRDFVFDRIVPLPKPRLRIDAATSTQTVELASGVTATIPPITQDMWLDVLPSGCKSFPLESMSEPYYCLALAVHSPDLKLSAPIELRVHARDAFPAMRRAMGMRFGRVNPETWRFAFDRPVDPEIEDAGKARLNRSWNYRCSISSIGFYYLYR